jgi:hypothetical protein
LDPSRFDHLTRLLGRAGGRRALISSLLAAAVGTTVATAAPKKRAKDKGRDGDGRDSHGRLRTERRQRQREGGKRRKTRKKRGGDNGGGQPPLACEGAGDCPDEVCQTKSCQNGQCAYAAVVDGASPNPLCATHCCEGVCCAAGATACNPVGLCCAPNCANRECGPDGCGGGGTCGACPPGATCNPQSGQCRSSCGPQTCPTGCCQGGECEDGDSGQACGTGGAPCVKCGAGSRCQNQHCTCEPDCDNRDCGPDGCGGSCGTCATGQVCDADDGECLCTARSCPTGCCTIGSGKPGECRPGNTLAACGTSGEECETCDADDEVCRGGRCVECADLCPNGCCAADGSCQPGDTIQACGAGGKACLQCTSQEQCANGECVPSTCAGRCTRDNDCPDLRNCVCDRAQGTCCARKCDGKVCGSDGCGGTCENLCPPNTVCNGDGTACLCNAQSCRNGCCSNGLGNPGTCEAGNTNPACGRPGQSCQTCTGREQCVNQQCVCFPLTCDDLESVCGTASDGCGGTLECGTCPDLEFPSCRVGVCVPCTIACEDGEDCINLANGDTICSAPGDINCGEPCSSNANCTDADYPLCITSFTNGANSNPPNQTSTIASLCEGEPAACGALE